MIKTILPKNHTDLEKAIDLTVAGRFDYSLPIGSYWSAQDCPAEFLPVLAWALSVDDWNDNWPENVKRQVISASVFVHKHKGTPAAMRAALNALDMGIALSEWFEYGGEPFTFKVDITLSNRGLDLDDLRAIRNAIKNTKNARSWLERLRIHLSAATEVIKGCALITGRIIRLPVALPDVPKQPVQPQTSFAISAHRRITIGAPT